MVVLCTSLSSLNFVSHPNKNGHTRILVSNRLVVVWSQEMLVSWLCRHVKGPRLPVTSPKWHLEPQSTLVLRHPHRQHLHHPTATQATLHSP